MKNSIVIALSILMLSPLMGMAPRKPIVDALHQQDITNQALQKRPAFTQRIKASWKHFGLATAGIFLPISCACSGWSLPPVVEPEASFYSSVMGLDRGLPVLSLHVSKTRLIAIDKDSYPCLLQENIWAPWYLFSAYHLYKGARAFINPTAPLSQLVPNTPVVTRLINTQASAY